MTLSRTDMAALVARDIPDGSYVNLGIGQPTTVAAFLGPERGIVLHTENGMLGFGPLASSEPDPDLVNAGKEPVSELPGASYFHHADSFAMMRGGHLDVCVLGAFQVSATGDLANWHTGEPGAIPAVGGAMDLAIGAKQVYVMMTLFARDGAPKLVPACTYPLTGLSCVSRVYTEHAVFHPTPTGVLVTETFGTTLAALRDRLAVPLISGPLLSALAETRDLLARPGNDFTWSSFVDTAAALAELDGAIAAVRGGATPGSLGVLFAPTGPIQEVAVSSGWGEAFLTLADRVDAA